MKNSNKKLLFERMSKVTGMPLKETYNGGKVELHAISLLYEGLQTLLYEADDEFLRENFTNEEIEFLRNIFKKLEKPFFY